MNYWVINSQYETYITKFNTKEDAIDFLQQELKDSYSYPQYYTLIEGKELQISRNVIVQIEVKD